MCPWKRSSAETLAPARKAAFRGRRRGGWAPRPGNLNRPCLTFLLALWMVFFSGPSREDGTVGEARFEVTRPLEGPPSSSADPSEPGCPTWVCTWPLLERRTLEASGRGEGTGRSGRLCLFQGWGLRGWGRGALPPTRPPQSRLLFRYRAPRWGQMLALYSRARS